MNQVVENQASSLRIELEPNNFKFGILEALEEAKKLELLGYLVFIKKKARNEQDVH